MVKFGPAGNSESFYTQGYTRTAEAPKWISQMGLNAFEYPFVRGVNMNDDTALILSEQANKYNVEFSVHSPYYVNFASPNEELVKKSFNYIMQCLHTLKIMGGKRVVIHPGSLTKQTRVEAYNNVKKRFTELIEMVYAGGYNDMLLCPETMGRTSYIGSVDEIVEICKIDKCIIPAFDFGHINAITNGSLKTKDDFRKVIDKAFDAIGDRAKDMHIHFSKIEYGLNGEIRHLTMADTLYGPEFAPLAEILHEYKMSPFIISESGGTMAEDALLLKQIYESIK